MRSGSHSPLPWSTSAIPTASDGSVKAAEEPPPVKLARTKSFIGRTTRIAGQSSGATERSQTSWGNVHVAVSSAYVRSKNTSPNSASQLRCRRLGPRVVVEDHPSQGIVVAANEHGIVGNAGDADRKDLARSLGRCAVDSLPTGPADGR